MLPLEKHSINEECTSSVKQNYLWSIYILKPSIIPSKVYNQKHKQLSPYKNTVQSAFEGIVKPIFINQFKSKIICSDIVIQVTDSNLK